MDRLQGLVISDKHIELIARQMPRRVRINEVGDTNFLVDEHIEKHLFETERRVRRTVHEIHFWWPSSDSLVSWTGP